MIIDGRSMAKDLLARTKARATELPHPPRVLALVASQTPATTSYLKIKAARAADAGCVLEVRHINDSLRPQEIIDMAKDTDALIVQLPLPEEMDTKAILDSIPIAKDADVLSSRAREEGLLLPPVASAAAEILKFGQVDVRGKRAVVIGDGWLVGNPCAKWLEQNEARVEIVTSKTGDISASLRDADIIISGAGSPHLIKPEMLQQGVVLIDAGTSESNGEVVGDADPACAAKCSLFTPVPGGVGPLAVACLFANAVTLAERATNN